MTIPSTFPVLHFSIGRVLPLDLAVLVEEVAVNGLAITVLLTFCVYDAKIVQIDPFHLFAIATGLLHSKSSLS